MSAALIKTNPKLALETMNLLEAELIKTSTTLESMEQGYYLMLDRFNALHVARHDGNNAEMRRAILAQVVMGIRILQEVAE